jgi:hypothetical protein
VLCVLLFKSGFLELNKEEFKQKHAKHAKGNITTGGGGGSRRESRDERGESRAGGD